MNLAVKCVDMDQDWTQRCCTIKADKFKLNQVLSNFVSNVLKFCSTLKGEVKVAVERIAVPERLIRPGAGHDDHPYGEQQRQRHYYQVNQNKLYGKHVQFNAGLL